MEPETLEGEINIYIITKAKGFTQLVYCIHITFYSQFMLGNILVSAKIECVHLVTYVAQVG